MGKPRKASKRLTTAFRSKVARKVREHKRKIVKSSKNVTQKKRKDPGIPKNLPFHDLIVAEAEKAKAHKLMPEQRKKSCLVSLQEETMEKSEQFYQKVQNKKALPKPDLRIEDPLETVRTNVWNLVSPYELQSHYGLPGVNPPATLEEFVKAVSISIGRLLKGGIPDLKSTSKKILSDAKTGKLGFLKNTKMEVHKPSTELDSPIIISEFSPEFKLSDTIKMSLDY